MGDTGTATQQQTIERAEVAALSRYFQVLGDATRLRILEVLLDGEATVSALVDALGVPQSRVSNHLACLRWCRLVKSRKEGRNVVYRLVDPRVRDLLEVGRRLSEEQCEHLASCSRIGPDWL